MRISVFGTLTVFKLSWRQHPANCAGDKTRSMEGTKSESLDENVVAKYRHGSKDSVDVDVVYVFDSVPPHKECVEFAKSDEDRNIITVTNGFVDFCFKGIYFG